MQPSACTDVRLKGTVGHSGRSQGNFRRWATATSTASPIQRLQVDGGRARAAGNGRLAQQVIPRAGHRGRSAPPLRSRCAPVQSAPASLLRSRIAPPHEGLLRRIARTHRPSKRALSPLKPRPNDELTHRIGAELCRPAQTSLLRSRRPSTFTQRVTSLGPVARRTRAGHGSAGRFGSSIRS